MYVQTCANAIQRDPKKMGHPVVFLQDHCNAVCLTVTNFYVILVNAALFNNRSPPDQAALGDEIVW